MSRQFRKSGSSWKGESKIRDGGAGGAAWKKSLLGRERVAGWESRSDTSPKVYSEETRWRMKGWMSETMSSEALDPSWQLERHGN